jgi:hypothetical protein
MRPLFQGNIFFILGASGNACAGKVYYFTWFTGIGFIIKRISFNADTGIFTGIPCFTYSTDTFAVTINYSSSCGTFFFPERTGSGFLFTTFFK